MASEEIHIGKRLIDGEYYYSLSDLAQKKSKQKPNEVLRNWINQADTIEFIEEWERNNNPRYKADRYIRFKMNHYNNKRLPSLYEFIRRMNTKGVRSVLENPSGIYAHTEICLEFLCWMDVKTKLSLCKGFLKSRPNVAEDPWVELLSS